MCLTVDLKEHPYGLPKIATEDIVVYKVLKRNNDSPYKHFKYKPFMLYSLGESFVANYSREYKGHFVVKGHSPKYNSRDKWNSFPGRKVWINKWISVYSVNEGFHAYTTIEQARFSEAYSLFTKKIVKMIIPKGAEYYIGYGYEIVSNKIVTTSLSNVNSLWNRMKKWLTK